MRKLFFCNIGWMDRYEGQEGKPDRIVGGGRYVRENETGHEVCNFLAVGGKVYGHVETIKGEFDRSIRIQSLGAGKADSVAGVTVIWTATHPEETGRRVVGWYENATVFRARQYFDPIPSKQHRKDGITSFRIVAEASDAHLIDIHSRDLQLGRGPNWIGHTPWWVPKAGADVAVDQFLRRLAKVITLPNNSSKKDASSRGHSGRGSPAPTDPYVRYVEAYEVKVSPQHNRLQQRFQTHLVNDGHSGLQPDKAGVDLRYLDKQQGIVLAEIKPCDEATCRFAIRTGMGQLLDYRQRASDKVRLLLTLGCQPNDLDKQLALTNGFGVAYPESKSSFRIEWPPTSIRDSL